MSIQESMSNLSRQRKRLLMIAADAVLLPSAATLSLLVWLGLDPVEFRIHWWLILIAPFIGITCNMLFGLYLEIIRFIGSQLIINLAKSVLVTTLLMLAIAFLVDRGEGMARGFFVIFPLVSFMLMGGARLGARNMIRQMIEPKRGKVVIYGAGTAGARLLSTLEADRTYEVTAFVDDNPQLRGSRIRNLRVISPSMLASHRRRYGVSGVMLALPSVMRSRRFEIIESLRSLGLKVMTVPTLQELLSGTADLSDLRELAIGDLLGRDQVKPDTELLNACITGKSVLVTGAGGSIGSELCRLVLRLKPERLVLMDNSEFNLHSIESELTSMAEKESINISSFRFLLGSVTDRPLVDEILESHRIDTIYHAAAYKHVPIVEHNEIEGVFNNAIGTQTVAEAAAAHRVETFVLISTDKAVRPTSVMGASKRMAEMILQAMQSRSTGTRFVMVRFGNVLGSSGSVVPIFRKQIQAGGPVTVTDPGINRYFMTIPEAVELVVQAGSMGSGGEVFVLDMGSPVKIVDLARNMISLAGLSTRDRSNPDGDIEIVFTGLRPGEKLHEELLIGTDEKPTDHPKIMQANEDHLEQDQLDPILGDMELAITNRDSEEVRRCLARAVTGYENAGQGGRGTTSTPVES
ncbi:MAG: hypothetical protein CMJ32_06635 [Phycisphaerae bacterium]|nr:hypothetical protein [Phycisphaerae bacterium]